MKLLDQNKGPYNEAITSLTQEIKKTVEKYML